jgi:hypothetical protein
MDNGLEPSSMLAPNASVHLQLPFPLKEVDAMQESTDSPRYQTWADRTVGFEPTTSGIPALIRSASCDATRLTPGQSSASAR